MMKRPFFTTGLCFLATMAAAVFVGLPAALAVGALCFFWVCIMAWNKDKSITVLTVVLLVVSIAVAIYSAYFVQRYQPLSLLQGQRVSIQGVIVEQKPLDEGAVMYTVDATLPSIYSGKVQVNLYSPVDLEVEGLCGITTKAKVAQSYRVEENLRNLAQGQDLFCTLDSVPQLEETPPDLTLYQRMLGLRGQLLQQADSLYKQPARSMVKGMVLGETTGMPEEMRLAVNASGLSHLMSVSGLHVSLLCSALMLVLGRCSASPRGVAAVTLPFLLLLVLLEGLTPSVVRAAVMMGVYVLCRAFFLSVDKLNALGLAALVVLLPNPFSALNVGFLLSFFAVLGIILFCEPMEKWMLNHRWMPQSKWVHGAVSLFCLSVCSQIFNLPILLYCYGRIAVIAPIASVFAIPVASALMILAIASLAVSFTPLAGVAGALAGVVTLLSKLLLAIAKLFALMPPLQIQDSAIFVYLLLAGFYLTLAALSLTKQPAQTKQIAAMIGLLVVLLGNISYLIVNKGVLHLISTENSILLIQDGRTVVIGNLPTEYEARQVLQLMERNGAPILEAVIVPKTQSNTSLGIYYLLAEAKAKQVIAPMEGRYTPHILKMAEDAFPTQPMTVTFLDGITAELVAEKQGYSVNIYAGDKYILKTAPTYDIIEAVPQSADVVLIPNEQPIILCTTGEVKPLPLSSNNHILIRVAGSPRSYAARP